MRETLTTAKILIDRLFQKVDESDCVDWAISMLEQGHDDEYLVRLAGLVAPLNPFEVADCLEQALQSLEFAQVSDSEVLAMYVAECLFPMIKNNQDLTSGLSKLKDICLLLDYSDDDFYNFYRLHYTYSLLKETEDKDSCKDSIDSYCYDSPCYWAGATKENIVSIIEQHAKDYIQNAQNSTRHSKALIQSFD